MLKLRICEKNTESYFKDSSNWLKLLRDKIFLHLTQVLIEARGIKLNAAGGQKSLVPSLRLSAATDLSRYSFLKKLAFAKSRRKCRHLVRNDRPANHEAFTNAIAHSFNQASAPSHACVKIEA
jgi:hypothetical protein